MDQNRKVKSSYSSEKSSDRLGEMVIYKRVTGYMIPPKNKVKKRTNTGIIGGGFSPSITATSRNWKNWVAQLDLSTCSNCRSRHGKVYAMDEIVYEEPPLHERCRCEIESLSALFSGTATRDGANGADYWLARYNLASWLHNERRSKGSWLACNFGKSFFCCSR